MKAGTLNRANSNGRPNPRLSTAPPMREPKIPPKRPMPSIQLTPVARKSVG
ncbi:hypothetical protein D3C72_1314830 [compost metagenome]